MAAETENPPTVTPPPPPPASVEAPPAAAEAVVPEKTATAAQLSETEKEAPLPAAEESGKEVKAAEEQKTSQQESFKEETNVISELPEPQRKALEDLKKLIQDALNKHDFTDPPPPQPAAKVAEPAAEAKEEKDTEPAKPEGLTETAPPEKTEEEKKEPIKEENPSESSAQVAAETVVVEKVVAAAVEGGEKTVEEVKETIVEVATPPSGNPPASADPPAEDPPKAEADPPAPPPPPEEVSIWGIPLLADDRTDVILLKFLRARDFNVKDAFFMLKRTIRWRKEFGVDELLTADLGGTAYEKAVFRHGVDKQGRPVCYNVFGEFQNKELYQNTFSDAEKRKKFLKWLIQFMEKMIRTLDFSPKGINTFVLVNDFKNSPGFGKRDLYKVINKFLQILQDNYPEFVAKQVCINVSWWYLAYNWVYLSLFTPRSKSKFVFAGPSKSSDTLFKYIAPQQVPVQFGGHSKEEKGEHEFSPADAVTEVSLKPGATHAIEFSFSEVCEVVWELRVIGWEVNYSAEFTPSKEGGYTLNIAKPKKIKPTNHEPLVTDTFKVAEPGKLILTIDNHSSKKKKLLYRSKVK